MRWLLVLCLVACRFGFDERRTTSADAAIDPTDDAGPRGACEPIACAAAGGSCVVDVCEISNNGENAIRCPAGMPCRIVCTTGSRPCRDGVSCAGATTCEVQCIGFRACQDGVDCGDSTCTVTCNGDEACEAGIVVGPAGTCTSHCCGSETCGGGVATCTNDNAC